MKFKYLIITILISLAMNQKGFSQTQATADIYFTVPEIALLDIEPNTSDIILNFEAPITAGEPLETTTDDSKWLNYTSTITTGGIPKNITAQITSETQIPGLKFELSASNYSGSGKGTLGSPAGKINLNTTAQAIISGIGGCHTNTGANSGHRLEYTASINDYSTFELPTIPSVDIIFTFSN